MAKFIHFDTGIIINVDQIVYVSITDDQGFPVAQVYLNANNAEGEARHVTLAKDQVSILCSALN